MNVTSIDFYILEGRPPADQQQVACRIAEKAWLAGHKVYVHASDRQQATQLNELLWTFRPGSFLPHHLFDDETPVDELTPIHIGWQEAPVCHNEVLINLAAEVPLFFSRFARVAEIVPSDDDARQHGRVRYKFYRDRGYQLATHTLTQG